MTPDEPVQAPLGWCDAHQGMPVAGRCTKCGAPYCIRCEPRAAASEQLTCGKCKGPAALSDEVAPPAEIERRVLRDSLISSGLLAATLVGVPVLLNATFPSPVGSQWVNYGMLAGGVVMGIALLLNTTRNLFFAWLLCALDLVLAVAIFMVHPVGFLWPLIFAVVSIRSASALGDAQREMERRS